MNPNASPGPVPSKRLALIRRLPHGGVYPALLRELGLSVDDLLDVSVNSNPYGPPRHVLASLHTALTSDLLARYPDPEALLLTEALAMEAGVSPAAILVGNGSAELFWALALAYLDVGDMALVLGPAFGEYTVASQVAGAQVRTVSPPTTPQLGWESAALVDAVRSVPDASVVWLANPANPTGQYLDQKTVEGVLDAFAGLLILDEAYLNFVAEPWSSRSLLDHGRVAIVRSLTKDYALAGLRLGYVVAHPAIIDTLRVVRAPWSVNALAQIAGSVALRSGDFIVRSRQRLLSDRDWLRERLNALGWECAPTATHYFTARIPDNWADAHAAWQALLNQRLMVRDCASFGLPRHVRIATRRPEHNERIVASVAAVANMGEANR